MPQGITRQPVPPTLAPDLMVGEGDTFAWERGLHAQGYAWVAGLDEVGRGPLAGPVVAACVVLPRDCPYHLYKDSKRLTPAARERLAKEIREIACWGLGLVSEAEIDRINILQASLLAMREALSGLALRPDFLLVDGKFPVPVSTPQRPLVRGESQSASIAAASIVAKVARDCLMREYHHQYPQYGFDRHQGYPTAVHRRALAEFGPCPIHRRSFAGVREFFVAP